MKKLLTVSILMAALAAPAVAVDCPAGSAFELRRPSDNVPLGCIDTNGRLKVSSTTLNGIDQNWPSAQGASNEVLKNDGSGNLTWGAAGTADALSANGTNCGAGQASQGIDTAGNAEGCFTPAGAGDAVLTATQTFSGENTFTSTTTLSNVRLSCPSGFQELHSVGRALGCIQTAEQGTGTWSAALDDCFDTYGGRTPMAAEYHLSAINLTLTDPTDDAEWLSEALPAAAVVNKLATRSGTNLDTEQIAQTTVLAYRCWIPK